MPLEPWTEDFGTLSVGIIGGGVAGLVTARQFLQEGARVTVYEQRKQLGGVWAAGYRNFSLQSPKELYQLPCKPFEPQAALPHTLLALKTWIQVASYPRGDDVARYLRNFARTSGVTVSVTKLSCRVESLERREGARGWVVLWRQSKQPVQRTEHHLVVIATGVYCSPFVPRLPGQERFSG